MTNHFLFLIHTHITMNKIFATLLFLISGVYCFAGNGDTTYVSSHTNVTVVTNPGTGSNGYPAWAVFPSSGTNYRKIILTLSHRCPSGMACGEWDYLDYVYIRRVGGANASSQDIELARYITPYGNSFNSSFHSSWTLDVTDYAQFLHDSVEIEYIHTGYETNVGKGWLINVDFALIEGTPVMNPVAFKRLWHGSFPFGNASNPIDNYLQPDTTTVNANTANLRLKITQSGHGSDASNCAEFCSKIRTVLFDNNVVDNKAVWRLCGFNPIYPQGGTWVYNRANWCPGNWVYPNDYNFAVAGGSTHIVDMNMPVYNVASPSANYVVEGQLFEYGTLNFSNDAAIDDILAPNDKFEYSRTNPVCNNPKIRLKNNGSNVLTSAVIKYGLMGEPESTYNWTGSLNTFQTIDIALSGLVSYTAGNRVFRVYLESVNNAADDYAYDDTAYSNAIVPEVMDTAFILLVKTNTAVGQNGYSLIDENGNILVQRMAGSMTANTIYRDTFYVSPGCFRYVITDSGGDGLYWWANPSQGTGYHRILRLNNSIARNFERDFGSRFEYNFVASPGAIVGMNDPVEFTDITVYPNPTTGKVNIDMSLKKPGDVKVMVYNSVGQVVAKSSHKNFAAGVIDFDLSSVAKGIYNVCIITNDVVKTQRIVLQ